MDADLPLHTTTAVLGTGAVGAAVARALLRAGFPVTVWNRTPDRARPLVDDGAREASSATEALTAGVAILALTDGGAVVEVLGDIGAAVAGKVVVALGTTTPEDAQTAAGLVERAGGAYLGVGLQHGPDRIGSPEARLAVGGPADALAAARGRLDAIGSVHHVGTGAAAAAVWDLALFGTWYDAQLGLLRALEAVHGAGVDVVRFAEAAAGQVRHVVDGAAGTAGELAAEDYPAGPADLRQHAAVVDALVRLRAGARLGDGGLATVLRLIEHQVARGWGGAGLTALLAEHRGRPAVS